ncbi:hypothetical protein EV363DRAFT_1296647 [Boletus edulis]|nr:hypothetical protein EV363DRAFT_1296647 [Boletus edulis]
MGTAAWVKGDCATSVPSHRIDNLHMGYRMPSASSWVIYDALQLVIVSVVGRHSTISLTGWGRWGVWSSFARCVLCSMSLGARSSTLFVGRRDLAVVVAAWLISGVARLHCPLPLEWRALGGSPGRVVASAAAAAVVTAVGPSQAQTLHTNELRRNGHELAAQGDDIDIDKRQAHVKHVDSQTEPSGGGIVDSSGGVLDNLNILGLLVLRHLHWEFELVIPTTAATSLLSASQTDGSTTRSEEAVITNMEVRSSSKAGREADLYPAFVHAANTVLLFTYISNSLEAYFYSGNVNNGATAATYSNSIMLWGCYRKRILTRIAGEDEGDSDGGDGDDGDGDSDGESEWVTVTESDEGDGDSKGEGERVMARISGQQQE